MSRQSLHPEELISRFSHQPEEMRDQMITIIDPPKAMEATQGDDCLSSLGLLDNLPPELMHKVIDMLDMQSITRLSRGSRLGKTVVQSHPAYRDLMTHAPEALAALSKTNLIHLHSSAQLLAALRSERCATCPEYGTYLFLPTCERCCWECLWVNPTRRVTTRTRAKNAFALPPKKVQQLPAMFSIPGTYYCIVQKRSDVPQKLVSIIDAKELALSIHGSAQNLAQVTSRREYDGQTAMMARYLQGEFSDSTGRDPLMLSTPEIGGIDRYFGTASIPFPSLPTPGVRDAGLWCKGCKWTFDEFSGKRLRTRTIADMVPSDCDSWRVLSGMTRRAYSKAGFLDHIQHCYGVQQLKVALALESMNLGTDQLATLSSFFLNYDRSELS